MKIKTVISPIFALSFMTIITLVILCLINLEIISSWRISYPVLQIRSFLFCLCFLLIQYVTFLIFYFKRTGITKNIYIIKKSNLKYVMLLLIFSGYKLAEFIAISGGFDKIGIGKNDGRATLDYYFETIYVVNFFIIYLLTFYKKKMKWKQYIFFQLLNMIILLGYALVLSSRIIIIDGLLLFILLELNTTKLKYIKTSKIIIGVIIIVIYLIYSSGVRDYSVAGKTYTTSVMQWGLSRILDYFTSTVVYTAGVIETVNKADISWIFPSVRRFFSLENIDLFDMRKKYGGALEYTNMGMIGQLYLALNWWSIFVAPILGWAYAFFWKKFKNHSLIGIYIYPLLYINILESNRILFIGWESIQLLLLIMIISIIFEKLKKKINLGSRSKSM